MASVLRARAAEADVVVAVVEADGDLVVLREADEGRGLVARASVDILAVNPGAAAAVASPEKCRVVTPPRANARNAPVGARRRERKRFPLRLNGHRENTVTIERDEPDSTDSIAPAAESRVSFKSADGAVTLAGTLALPAAGRRVPAAILVSGTGPIDRDVTLAGHALFRVMAHRLAHAGIATLRFDNGAILATPLLSGTDNLIRSLALLARGSLQRDSEYERLASDLATLVGIARTEEAPEQDPNALETAASLAPRIFSERTALILDVKSMSAAGFLRLLSSPCLETCLSWDPSRVVPLVTCPVLVVYGSKDVQAPAFENRVAAHALLGRLKKRHWVIREIAGVNHAFQRCTTGMPDEYESIDHVMAGEVLDEVATWINSRIPNRGQGR